MPPILRLNTIGSGESSEITRAEGGIISIGREPENVISVDSESISRRHGRFFSAGDQWCFVDNGSTNGSWLNRVQVAPGSIRLLHDGDFVQLADFVVQVRLENVTQLPTGAHAVLVFKRDSFVEERVLADAQDRVIVGGPEGTYFIEGESTERPQLVIALHGEHLELTVNKTGPAVMLNQMAVAGTSKLSDRDEVTVGPYRFVIANPAQAVEQSPMAKQMLEQVVASDGGPRAVARDEHVGEWEDVQAKAVGKKFVFGSPPAEDQDVEGTIAVRRDEMMGSGGFGLGPASRMMSTVSGESNEDPTDEKFYLLLGLVAIALLIGGLMLFF